MQHFYFTTNNGTATTNMIYAKTVVTVLILTLHSWSQIAQV